MRRALETQALILLALAVLAMGAVTPLAGLVRWTFPGGSALLAGYLALRGRTGAWLTLCLWLFLLTPFVRRLVDANAGYSQANILMLAPYLATGWAALQLPRYFLDRTTPLQTPLAAVLACALYGFAMAVAGGRLLPGAIDLLRWTAPPLLAVALMADRTRWNEACAAVRATALVALPLVGLYGIWQFVAPPRWDAIWMMNTPMSSIGFPRPFEIRVFATLNSPASLAFWLVGLMLVNVTERSPARWLNLAAGASALAVSLVRSAWLGLALGLAMLALRAQAATRLAIVAAAAAAAFLAPLALTNPRAEAVVSQRLETLFNIGGDKSYSDRSLAYAAFRRELVEHPWGEGFGIANAAGAYAESTRVIDGGPIEIFLSLGVVCGSLYIGAVAAVVGATLARRRPPDHADLFVAAVAIVTVEALELSSATTVVGEIGVVFWLAAALVMAAPHRTSAANSTIQLRRDATFAQFQPNLPSIRSESTENQFMID